MPDPITTTQDQTAPANLSPTLEAPAAASIQQAVEGSGLQKPEGLDDRFFDAKAGVKWGDLNKEFGELSKLKAEIEARKTSVPDSPDKYEKALPKDFPDADKFQIDPDSPAWKLAAEHGHKAGWTQEDFSRNAAIFAQVKVAEATAEAKAMEAFVKAESAKLGPNAAGRADAAVTFATKAFGERTAQILQAMGAFNSSEIVTAIEAHARNLSAQNVDPMRTTPAPGGADKSSPEAQVSRWYPQMAAASR